MNKLQNHFTTPEQSKRLLELGVPAWTADCYYPTDLKQNPIEDATPTIIPYQFDTHEIVWDKVHAFPCWSVGRLMEIYDTCLPDNGDWPNYFKYGNLLEYAIDCIDVAIEKELIDFSKLEE